MFRVSNATGRLPSGTDIFVCVEIELDDGNLASEFFRATGSFEERRLCFHSFPTVWPKMLFFFDWTQLHNGAFSKPLPNIIGSSYWLEVKRSIGFVIGKR